MKLPNPDKLVVERDKIADYLLNAAHRYGASKGRGSSRSLGFGLRIGSKWLTRCASMVARMK
jgi:hypothetical protein